MNRFLKTTAVQEPKTLPEGQPILCFYKNTTDKIQIAKISNFKNYHFEQVVFPAEKILFNAFPEAELEIYTGSMMSAVLIEKIRCSRLQVNG
ncbi:DUF1830 domain-containing protein [Allocoleopsis franciscana]|uniref:Uncharacterized protein n=1 Tax=Allocoleopsis franciscana PCC 7113 TaxID=1173027 RepID=K9WBC5_9CYAN|nr:DUF1830 domain-containing protein [Allocoleopsis franciscana]AFZ17538.1 protein of unknown function (DUF1830) [Allocoleopsis franciscana PCC 7113]